MENENTENLSDDILTFDEILDDPYYKAEFDRRVQQALDIKKYSLGVILAIVLLIKFAPLT